VAQFGPRRWDELTGLISCPVALLALKWHVIRLGRIGAIAKTSKAYSDWELCVLFVVGSSNGLCWAQQCFLSCLQYSRALFFLRCVFCAVSVQAGQPATGAAQLGKKAMLAGERQQVFWVVMQLRIYIAC